MPHLITQHPVIATPLLQPYLPLGTGVIHYSNITHTCQIARLHGGKWCNRPAWKSSRVHGDASGGDSSDSRPVGGDLPPLGAPRQRNSVAAGPVTAKAARRWGTRGWNCAVYLHQ